VISAMIAAAVDITADWLDQAEKRVIRFAIKSLRPEPLSSPPVPVSTGRPEPSADHTAVAMATTAGPVFNLSR